MGSQFKWTENLVAEFIQTWLYISDSASFDLIEQFMESKQPKPLITTEDGVKYYEGEKKDIWGVHTKEGYNEVGAWHPDIHPEYYEGLKSYEYFFSTREAAEEWILNNKPLFSLQEIKTIGNIRDDNPYYKTLVDLAKSKLK